MPKSLAMKNLYGTKIEYPCGEPEPKECSEDTRPCYCRDANTGAKVPMDCGGKSPGSKIYGKGNVLPQCERGGKILKYCNGMTLEEYNA